MEEFTSKQILNTLTYLQAYFSRLMFLDNVNCKKAINKLCTNLPPQSTCAAMIESIVLL